MKRIALAVLTSLILCPVVFQTAGTVTPVPSPSIVNRARIAEAIRLAGAVQDRIWPDWSKAPFSILLVTQGNEFLINHPADPPAGFKFCMTDRLIGGKVYYRSRKFETNLQATFPLEDGIPTIVIGTAENSVSGNSSAWVATLLHEHFHQLQMSQPDYYAEVNRLGLQRGDQTGTWMLKFPFPYTDETLSKEFRRMGEILVRLQEMKAKDPALVTEYGKLQKDATGAMSAEDAAYWQFQLWQEGVARYTQMMVARMAAFDYQPSPEFQKLPDYIPFEKVSIQLEDDLRRELNDLDLKKMERVAFYPLGAGQALLLDRYQRNWKQGYFKQKFQLPPLQ